MKHRLLCEPEACLGWLIPLRHSACFARAGLRACLIGLAQLELRFATSLAKRAFWCAKARRCASKCVLCKRFAGVSVMRTGETQSGIAISLTYLEIRCVQAGGSAPNSTLCKRNSVSANSWLAKSGEDGNAPGGYTTYSCVSTHQDVDSLVFSESLQFKQEFLREAAREREELTCASSRMKNECEKEESVC